MPSSKSSRAHGDTVTVRDVRRWLEGFDDDAPVVVPCGLGYEHPRIVMTSITPVLVAGRFLYDDEGEAAVALRPVNG